MKCEGESEGGGGGMGMRNGGVAWLRAGSSSVKVHFVSVPFRASSETGDQVEFLSIWEHEKYFWRFNSSEGFYFLDLIHCIRLQKGNVCKTL